MLYKVERGFCLGGGRDVYPGDVIRCPEDIKEERARECVRSGRLSVPKPAAAERTTDGEAHASPAAHPGRPRRK